MRFLILIVLLSIAAGALFATSPTRAVFKAEIESKIASRIAEMDPNAAEDDVTRLLLTTCKLGEAGCARLIRSLMDVEFENRVLYSKARLQLGREDPITCYGVLNKVICPSL